jgi:hypothetical protein
VWWAWSTAAQATPLPTVVVAGARPHPLPSVPLQADPSITDTMSALPEPLLTA